MASEESLVEQFQIATDPSLPDPRDEVTVDENKENESQWVDVTHILEESAKHLELGEMLQGPQFSLHAAMVCTSLLFF